MLNAAKNRRELIAAGLSSRRDLWKMGLLTAAGMLAPKRGLSAQSRGGSPGSFNLCLVGNQAASPPTTPFVEPLPIMPKMAPVGQLNPPHTLAPNTAAREVRSGNDQAFSNFPAQLFYEVKQQAFNVTMSPQLPPQTVWGFNDTNGNRTSPGPTYVAHYGVPQITRNRNELPPASQNGGFGMPSVTTHLHNGHTPSESDGNPCDFYEIGSFCDQHYPNVLAGFSSTNPPNGDINESLSTLWYHDHGTSLRRIPIKDW